MKSKVLTSITVHFPDQFGLEIGDNAENPDYAAIHLQEFNDLGQLSNREQLFTFEKRELSTIIAAFEAYQKTFQKTT